MDVAAIIVTLAGALLIAFTLWFFFARRKSERQLKTFPAAIV